MSYETPSAWNQFIGDEEGKLSARVGTCLGRLAGKGPDTFKTLNNGVSAGGSMRMFCCRAKKRTVFLFGSGATLAWGSPTTHDLTNVVREHSFKTTENERITEFIYAKLLDNGYSGSDVKRHRRTDRLLFAIRLRH